MNNSFVEYLNKFAETDWLAVVQDSLPDIHEVDRNAVQIWFRFFPLELHRYVQEAEDREELIRKLALQGHFELKEQIDTSHHFLYGHRYWPQVKRAIIARSTESSGSQDLAEIIRNIGAAAASEAKAEYSAVSEELGSGYT